MHTLYPEVSVMLTAILHSIQVVFTKILVSLINVDDIVMDMSKEFLIYFEIRNSVVYISLIQHRISHVYVAIPSEIMFCNYILLKAIVHDSSVKRGSEGEANRRVA